MQSTRFLFLLACVLSIFISLSSSEVNAKQVLRESGKPSLATKKGKGVECVDNKDCESGLCEAAARNTGKSGKESGKVCQEVKKTK